MLAPLHTPEQQQASSLRAILRVPAIVRRLARDNTNGMRLPLLMIAAIAWGQDQLGSVERLLAASQPKQALDLLQSMPQSYGWHLLASRAYEALNDPAKAVEQAEAALALNPKGEAAHLQLGQIFLSHNTPAAALEIFTDAQQVLPDSFLIQLGKGLALKELQKYDEAVETLRACLQQQPGSGVAFDGMATSLLHSQNFEVLLRESSSFRARNPQDFRAYYFEAAARDGLRQPDAETQKLLEQSLERNSQFAASWGLLGKILLRQDNPSQAVTALERAVSLRPNHVPSHMNLGKAYRLVGRAADSEREFQLVRQLNEKGQQPPPSLTYHRGQR